jgi:hypothetical protein
MMVSFLKKYFQRSTSANVYPTVGREVQRICDRGLQSAGFELCIPQGHHLSSGHIRLEHQVFYTIRLSNHHNRRCDVRLSIDGKEVGNWRIPANSTIELERPVNDTGRFTFYRLGSEGALAAGLSESEAIGLISAIFIPELIKKTNSVEIIFSKRTHDARGGTGLSGMSGQKYGIAESILPDIENTTTIYVRLVAHDRSAHPLKSTKEITPPPPLP